MSLTPFNSFPTVSSMTDGIHTEVHPGPEEPVLRKVATGEAGRRALAREADRLERAAHPGVVVIIDRAEDHLDLRWAGGHTLATQRPEASAVAATFASIAATVADLHQMGIVHGRLRAEHVVIDGDGRARLCGLAAPAAGQPEPTSADDVAAIGQLLAESAGNETEVEPIPDRRWRRTRWSGYHRRSLLTLADHASHPDPAVRPTARALAASLADLTPTRRLPEPSAADLARGPDAVRQRWRAAFGHPAEPLTGPDDGKSTEPASIDPEEAAVTFPTAIDSDDALDPKADAPTPLVSAPGSVAPEPEPAASAPRTLLGPLGLRLAGPEVAAHPGRPSRSASRAGTSSLARPAAGRARRWGSIGAAAAAAIVLFGLAGRVNRSPGESNPVAAQTDGSNPVGGPLSSVALSPTRVTAAPNPVGCPQVAPPSADVDADGCPDSIEVHGRRVQAGGLTWEAGNEGDAVSVGDWDCDGKATVGLVRPRTGEVFLFDHWSGSAGIDTQVRAIVSGALALAPTAEPCTTPRVLRADGTSTAVPSARGAVP